VCRYSLPLRIIPSPPFSQAHREHTSHVFRRLAERTVERQQAAHNATQDHIRLRTEPFLNLQRQAGRNTEHNKLGITLVDAAMLADIPTLSWAESETQKIATITSPTPAAVATLLSYKLGALVVT
jgi:hypothetical protein